MTDNGKVFTGRFGLGPGPVRFDRICAENGIRHLLTAPYSPTTTGKVERLHKTMRAEFFRLHEHEFVGIAELQTALDGWVEHYNTERPHQSVRMRPPADRFRLAARDRVVAVDAPAESAEPVVSTPQPRAPGVGRWVDQRGQVSVAGFSYQAGRVFTGELVDVVVSSGLVEILHAGVLIATHAQRHPPDKKLTLRHQPQRRTRRPGTQPMVVRVADRNGAVSFAGALYRAGRAWARRSIEVSLIAGSVQLACDGQVIRVHAARHDPAKEHGAFATPHGRPRKTTTAATG